MDLINFNSNIKKNKIIEKILIDNLEVKVTLKGEYIYFYFKKKEAIKKYQNLVFFSPTKSIISDSKIKVNDFFKESIKEGVEGLMFKKLNSQYIPGQRIGAMAKLKETKEDIDVVIIGAEYGKGKRAGFYSSFLVAVQNKNSLTDEVEYLEIGKVSSGIKEKEYIDSLSLNKISKLLEPYKIKTENTLTYFEPKIIIQIKYQEIQKSNFYNSGFALRFPRIISLREDKSIDEINTLDDIKKFSNYNEN